VVTPENKPFYRNFCQNADKANKYKVYCSRRRRRIGVVGAQPMPFKWGTNGDFTE